MLQVCTDSIRMNLEEAPTTFTAKKSNTEKEESASELKESANPQVYSFINS